ncbi:hypothetical protein [Chryseobacterium sp. Leaf394]|uniref:hypothetical protein n=1 Tax=Chryseobacterium sp. Leaf394 TaxID=1736361 RepID=UPI0006F971A5|nr:hypothetical protein [Chryseobacterium sp. Leaf394]KQS90227.1 hypothetical protein ASG21_14830 [Chryseobacterium sp. Leaf394]
MKSLYIIPFLALSLNIYAQENKKSTENLTQEAESYKESKTFESKMMQEAKENQSKKPLVELASEQGLAEKQKNIKAETPKDNSGKLLPNTASLEEVLAAMPGRKVTKAKQANTAKTETKGFVLTPEMTVYDIKKTIPKN